MQTKKTTSWEIQSLPFVWGALDQQHNGHGLPDLLPFKLLVDEQTGLLIQKPDTAVEQALSVAYELGSVLGSNVDEHGQGRHYADDFLAFIEQELDSAGLEQGAVLEIGCGNGYLMSRLVGKVGSVLGIEPGPQGQHGAEKFGVNIIRGFFPEGIAEQKFSAIILNSVLEHIQDPVSMIRLISQYLEPNGLILISVPDESAYILNDDVSTLFHEHWSFFDQTTLKNTIATAQMRVLRCEPSGFGASLYASIAMADGKRVVAPEGVDEAIELACRYMKDASKNCDVLREACQKMTADGKTLGVYVPARFINAMAIAGIPDTRIRFFDDDPALIGTFYPSIPIVVESGATLIENPTDSVLIMSRTFGPKLAERLRTQLGASTVMTIADVLDR